MPPVDLLSHPLSHGGGRPPLIAHWFLAGGQGGEEDALPCERGEAPGVDDGGEPALTVFAILCRMGTGVAAVSRDTQGDSDRVLEFRDHGAGVLNHDVHDNVGPRDLDGVDDEWEHVEVP